MNSSLKHYTDTELYNFYKGLFYISSPVTIPLSLIILTQNSFIVQQYYKARSRFIPAMFMGIAAGEILHAQGQLILSLTSILVYSGGVNRVVLYRCVFYYMITALPGYSCSNLMNLVQIIYVTVKLVRPYWGFDEGLLRRGTGALCCLITYLHVLDTVMAVAWSFLWKTESEPMMNILHSNLVVFCVVPGLISTTIVLQLTDTTAPNLVAPDLITSHSKILCQIAAIYILVPTLIVFIATIVEIVYLRRWLSRLETVSLLPGSRYNWRHVSVTVCLTSTLFFVCNSVFPVLYNCNHGILTDGVTVGVGLFIVPLVYSAVFSVIVIFRKPQLRKKYREIYVMVFTCSPCRKRIEDSESDPYLSDTTQHSVTPLSTQ